MRCPKCKLEYEDETITFEGFPLDLISYCQCGTKLER